MAVELSREELLEKGVIKKYSPLERKILEKVPEGRTTAVEVMRKLEEPECYFLKDYLGAIERLKEEGEIEMDIVEEKSLVKRLGKGLVLGAIGEVVTEYLTGCPGIGGVAGFTVGSLLGGNNHYILDNMRLMEWNIEKFEEMNFHIELERVEYLDQG